MPAVIPRYLVSFHPKRIPHHFVDVLIVGGGIAGMRAAMAVDPQLSTLIVTKDRLDESSSSYAQGGIAGVLDPEDRFEDHIHDTLIAGADLCDREVVELVVREAPAHIRQLIAWGTQFDTAEDGDLTLGREGGHSRHRIAHALGDATGREIMRAMIQRAREVLKAQIWQDTFTIDLLTHEGSCRGALVWHRHHGRTFVWAKQTLLCTGGVGQMYRETTNPSVATGDGHAMAFRAGVELRDMEFMQFHPTVLYIAGSSRTLITEAVRGEGAILLDSQGQRFMPEYDQRAELAPRDVVSQAIVDRMHRTHHPCVYLDLSPIAPEKVLERFPGIARNCAKFGIDITKDRVPVRPGAHYMIGGMTVDQRGRTSLAGLWAAGEATSSGLHGANRLASNSLLEGLVYGAHAGSGAAEAAWAMPDTYQAIPLEFPVQEPQGDALDLADIKNSLKSLTWRAAGVSRNGPSLTEAAQTIEHWCHYALSNQLSDPAGWEVQNMLTVARMVLASALAREESRGVHLRSDFQASGGENWRRHLTISQGLSPT